MSTWSDPAKWRAYVSEQGCPVCNQQPGQRPAGERDHAALSVSRLIADRITCMKGQCCLVLKAHAVELHELAEADAMDFMHDIRRVSRALQAVTGAVKINYEIHGNTIPHLHLHLWPRQIGDRFEGAPIDWRAKDPAIYTDSEFESFIAAMQCELR